MNIRFPSFQKYTMITKNKRSKKVYFISILTLLALNALNIVFLTFRHIFTNHLNESMSMLVKSEHKMALETEFNDLKKIRESLINEIPVIEQRKNYLSYEADKISRAIELENSLTSDLLNRKEFLEGQMRYIEDTKSGSHPFGAYSTLDSCFNYSKCQYDKKIKIYFYQNTILNLSSNVDFIFEAVDSISDSCLAISIVSNENETQEILKNLSKIKENSNLLILSLIDNYNFPFNYFTKMHNETGLESFKCSLYASFNAYRNIDAYNNLFFHFSLIKTNVDNQLVEIYQNQKPNKLLLTYKRNYLLSYYLSASKENIDGFGMIKEFQKIDCKITDNNCIKNITEHLKILSTSTFLAIENENSLKYTAWTSGLTERFLEALSVGTIPCILDIDSKLPLKDLINWDEIVVRIPSSKIQQIHSILATYSEADLISRRIRAVKVYNRYFKTPETQFNTLISAVRERIRLSAVPIEDYRVETINEIPKMLENQPNLTIFESYISINDDEYLGPPRLLNEKPYESKSYQFNLSVYSYLAWNKYFYPFNLLPSTPFDSFLPIDLKYSSIDHEMNPRVNYFHGGTAGGQYFHEKLAGNNEDNEEFTLIIMKFDDENLLINILHEYFKLPYLNQIIVLWNSKLSEISNKFYLNFRNQFKASMLRIVFSANVSSINRFKPYDFIKTDAVMSLNADSQLRNDEIIFAFRVWRENRDRLVGFTAHFHSWDPKEKSYSYHKENSCEYSIIGTNAAFYHRYYHYYFYYMLDERIQEKINELNDCEDIAFNYMISDLTRKPPIKVTGKTTFNCTLCSNTENIRDQMYSTTTRSRCINDFNKIYGYNPLLYSQARGDSVFYLSSIGKKLRPCFRHL